MEREDDAARVTSRVAVVVGSTRPKRICLQIAHWVRVTAAERSPLVFENVDLRDIDLPFLDEPEPAASGLYAHDHTRRWSELVSSYDAFVFVFPQYNWGYPAVLKNALDYLYAEWSGKPAGLVTYGTRGGTRGAAQMQTVLHGLHMRNTSTNPALNTDVSQLDATGTFVDVGSTFAMSAHAVHAMAADLAVLLTTPIAVE